MEYDSIEALMQDINIAIQNSFQGGTVKEDCERVIEQEIEDAVYNAFEPNHYQRRYKEGGYGDKNNLEFNIQHFNGSVSVDITNNARANGQEAGRSLDEIIESGKGYRWKRRPGARPAMRNAEERIVQENVVEKAVISDLKMQGFEVTLE